MASLDKIRTHGFRHWYERQLLECHAWLVSCFLGIICAACGVEVSGHAGPGARLFGLALTVAGIVMAYYSWRRYRAMLEIAERLGERAVCPACQAYAKFAITASGPTPLRPRLGAVTDTRKTRCRRGGCCAWHFSSRVAASAGAPAEFVVQGEGEP